MSWLRLIMRGASVLTLALSLSWYFDGDVMRALFWIAYAIFLQQVIASE